MNGLWLRATGAEDIFRPRRLLGRFRAAPQLHRLTAAGRPRQWTFVRWSFSRP